MKKQKSKIWISVHDKLPPEGKLVSILVRDDIGLKEGTGRMLHPEGPYYFDDITIEDEVGAVTILAWMKQKNKGDNEPSRKTPKNL